MKMSVSPTGASWRADHVVMISLYSAYKKHQYMRDGVNEIRGHYINDLISFTPSLNSILSVASFLFFLQIRRSFLPKMLGLMANEIFTEFFLGDSGFQI